MSDYFDRVGVELRAAIVRGAHRPWHVRVSRRVRGMGRRGQGLALVIVALVFATPAVGAASNWFGLGAPQHFAGHSPSQGIGAALPAQSELTSLRVADPEGGPPWGLRVVRTTRGDTCLEIGRVENGRLGSLGIDRAWHDDHLFHPFPNTSETPDCGITDAAGNGFVNSVNTGQVANGQPVGNRAPGCGAQIGPRPPCPAGTVRIVFMGLLGPDATSITYEVPDGKLRTERTVGDDGAYLLVFPANTKTCALYTDAAPCPGVQEGGSTSPNSSGAIKRVTYRNGHVCSLIATPTCPMVGYVAFKQTKLSASEVATPIKVGTVTGRRFCAPKGDDRLNTFSWIRCSGLVPKGYNRINLTDDDAGKVLLADISFTARQPVTSSRSSYVFAIEDPPGCSASGGGGEISRGNVRRGSELRFQSDAAYSDCHGVYRGTIYYMRTTAPSSAPSPLLLMLLTHAHSARLHYQLTTGISALAVGHFSYRVP